MDDQKQQITSNSDSGPCDIHSIHEQVSAMSVSEKSTILHVSAKQLPDTSDSGSNVHVQCDARLNVHTPRSMTDEKSSTHVLTMIELESGAAVNQKSSRGPQYLTDLDI